MSNRRFKLGTLTTGLLLALGIAILPVLYPWILSRTNDSWAAPLSNRSQDGRVDGPGSMGDGPLTEVDDGAEMNPSRATPSHPHLAGEQSVLKQFSGWVRRYGEADTRESTSREFLAIGEKLAINRRAVLGDLIESDPQRAVAAAIPDNIRRELPEMISRHLENRISGWADFRVAIVDGFERAVSEVKREVTVGGTSYAAFVYGTRLHLGSWRNIPLHGIAIGHSLAVLDEPALHDHWAGDEGGGRGHGDAAASGLTQGPKTLLFMPVAFLDDPAAPITQSAANLLMSQVNQWFVEQSYNSTSIVATVTPLLVLQQTKAYYRAQGVWTLQTEARAAALAEGYDTANYDLDIVSNQILGQPNFNFAGFATVGGKGVMLQVPSLDVAVHELGHNYGLWHANFWSAAGDSVIGPGSTVEYGNSFDTMGSRNSNPGMHDFNVCFKNRLNWLPSAFVETVTASGLYRINGYDVPGLIAGRKYAIRIQKDYLRSYWGEFRRKFTDNPWTQNGLILNWGPWESSAGSSLGGTVLLDTTPGTPSGNSGRDDSPVVTGRTFSDSAAGIHVTPVNKGAAGTESWIDVQVNLGAFPGNVAPTLQITADQTSVSANVAASFTAGALDSNGDPLAYYWDFGDFTFGTNSPFATKSWSNDGEYAVRCTVSDMKGGIASRNLVITVGVPGTFRMSGRIMTPDSQPLEGVRIDNSLSGSFWRGASSDSDGYYTLTNLPAGSYTLRAVKYGYSLAAAGWSNPVSAGPELSGMDWIAGANPVVTVRANDSTAAESGGDSGTFTLTRSGSLTSALTVRFDLSGSAGYAGDYALSPPPVLGSAFQHTIPAGVSSVNIVLTPESDLPVEGPETAVWTIVENSDYSLGFPSEAAITIADGQVPGLPLVTVTVPDDLAPESGPDAGAFLFSRSGSVAGDLAVHYSVSGTAGSGADYTQLSGIAIIAAGSSNAAVSFFAVDDTEVEGGETVRVTIIPDAGYAIGTPGAGTVNIADDDPVSVVITTTDSIAGENGADTAGFTVTRAGSLAGNLTIHYSLSGAASNGGDYIALPGTVTIPAGQVIAGFTVTPLNDSAVEGTETIVATLLSDPAYNIGNPGVATALMLDDDVAGITLTAPDNLAAEPGSNPGTFTFARTGATSDPLTVHFSLSGTALDGVDYATTGNSVVIPAGSSTTDLTITPLDDSIRESAETVVVTLQPSGNSAYSVITTTPQSVSIADNDSGGLPGVGFISAASSAPESQFIVNVSVALSAASPVPVLVNCDITGGTAAGGVDYATDLPATLFFPAGLVSQNVTIIGINDNQTVQPNRTVVVTLSSPSNALLDARAHHTFTILDDDGAGGAVTVAAIGGDASESGPGTGTFRISRAGGTNSDLKVNFQVTGTASSPSDFLPIGNSAVIPAGQSYVDIVVAPVDDATPEIVESVVLTLTSASAASVGAPNNASVLISDNDGTSPVTIGFSTTASAAEEQAAAVLLPVSISRVKTVPVTVQYAATGGTAAGSGVDYTLDSGTITFAPGETVQMIALEVHDDILSEADETVIITLQQPSGASLNGNTTHIHTISNPAGTLAITPDGDFVSGGNGGGPFEPPGQIYTLENRGDTALAWTAAANTGWITLSPAGGTLNPGQTVDVALSINDQAASLLPGRYPGVVGFSNTTNSQGSGDRNVALDLRLAAPAVAAEPLFTGGATNTISWSPLAGAAAYEVQRSDVSDFAEAVSSGLIPGTNHQFSGLIDGRRYYFRVRAGLTAVSPLEGPWSAPVVSTQDASAPAITVTDLGKSVVTGEAAFSVSGTASDNISGVSAVIVNGTLADLTLAPLTWSVLIGPLKPGGNPVQIVAFDNAVPPNQALEVRSVYYATGSLDADQDGLPDGWEFSHQLDLFDDGSGESANGPFGDIDLDGMQNLLEYAFNRDPNRSDAPAPVSLTTEPGPGGDAFRTITYSRRMDAPGISDEVQFSTDGKTWAADPEHLEPVSLIPGPDGITESVTLRILPAVGDPASRRRFFRLNISAIPQA